MRYTSKFIGYHKCPFYDHEYISTINCEGILSAAENVMKFESEEAKYKYIEGHCLREFPTNCPLFNILWEQNENI